MKVGVSGKFSESLEYVMFTQYRKSTKLFAASASAPDGNAARTVITQL